MMTKGFHPQTQKLEQFLLKKIVPCESTALIGGFFRMVTLQYLAGRETATDMVATVTNISPWRLKILVFVQALWFSPLLKNQHFQIPIRSGAYGHISMSS